MKNDQVKNKKWEAVLIAMAAVSLAFGVLAVFDTVRATGTGYYMYLSSGLFTREGWDLICVALITLAMLLLVFIPTCIMQGRVADAALLFLANGALTQYVRPDKIIAPFTGGDVMDRYAILFRYRDYIPLWITVLACLIVIGLAGEDRRSYDSFVICCAGVSMLFLVMGYALNAAYELFVFASGYALVLPLSKSIARTEKKSFIIPAAVLFIGTVWRLYLAMAIYHM